jgi:excisionase family DNA binding protein
VSGDLMGDFAFTAEELAAKLKISKWQVYELAKQKNSGLKSFNIGKRVLFSKEAILAYIRHLEEQSA